jgi:prepilin-type processing-associated H-X9-DG protein
VPWTRPDDLPYAPDQPLPKLGGLFPNGFNAAFADGSVRFINRDTDEAVLRALITWNGGEQIDRAKWP